MQVIGLILAAGKGTRMKPYSNAINKEMSLIGNYPVIDYNVRAVANAGIRRALIVLGEGKWQICEYLRDGAHYGVSLSYVYQDMNGKGKGTAKAIEVAEPWVDEDVMVVYGDSFFYPFDFFRDQVRFHAEEKADVTLGAYMMRDHKEYGVMRLSGNKVIDILEKASEEDVEGARIDGVFAVNSGPLIFTRKVFDFIRRTTASPTGEFWITDTIRLMIKEGYEVVNYRIPSGVFWRDIGRMEHRVEAEAFLLRSGNGGNLNNG
jgi:bifunctional UDP-N-acetylglucosamine pyrophosphorylase/glucosamine-1-phosphate N-acetyltransferase